jgi:predicted transcriptional regulator
MKAVRSVDWQLVIKTDVVARILEIAERDNKISKENISTDAYLSRPQTNEYLSLMTRNELLSYDADSKAYKSTRKGDAFLRTYQERGHFISLIDEEIGL